MLRWGQAAWAFREQSSASRVSREWSRQLHFGLQQTVHRLPPPNERRRLAIDQHFGRPWPRVVVGSEHHAVSSGIQNGQHVTLIGYGQLAATRKKISRLTDRADHIHGFVLCSICVQAQRNDLVIRVIE